MRYPLILLVFGSLVFATLAISPPDRLTWALENLLAVLGVVFLWRTRRTLRLSSSAYTSIFVFFVLHEIGAHFTYTLVPYDDWCEAITGRTLNSYFGWQRNHYDRAVHLAFGLLLVNPVREMLLHVVSARRALVFVFAFVIIVSCSAMYELVEWVAALVFGADTGAAYVGAQGDEWDAQKDMALAAGGAMTGLFAAWLFRTISSRTRR